jgi:hypothetical protein
MSDGLDPAAVSRLEELDRTFWHDDDNRDREVGHARDQGEAGADPKRDRN